MLVLVIINLIVSILILVHLVMFSYRQDMTQLKNMSSENRALKEFQSDPFMDDVMDYTLNKGITCLIRPGNNNVMTLFYHDEKDHSEYAITELHTVSAPRKSTLYKKAFKELQDRIDIFCEQKETIMKEMKDRINVRN